MSDDLTPTYEALAGQVILDGRPAGLAGEAVLVPVKGVELAFDLADGHLVRAIVADDHGPAAALLIRLFGPATLDMVRAATESAGRVAGKLAPEAKLSGALSRLARLDAARATSPVPASSPWWAVEAGVLAERAGLHDRALAEARRGIHALVGGLVAVPPEAARVALAAADILPEDDRGAVDRLRNSILEVSDPCPPHGPGFDVAAEVKDLEKACPRLPGLHWVLDPGLAPVAPFRFGLSPRSDLLISHESSTGRLVVTAALAPGADRAAVGTWHARLVDPDRRRVLAIAGFGQARSQAQAEFRRPYPLDELNGYWVEVTDCGDRPVLGTRTHRARRALRWADAALRAERVPVGLAPGSASSDWAGLAAAAWDRCRRDWAAAGDSRRAAAGLTPRVPPPGPACLAEVLGA